MPRIGLKPTNMSVLNLFSEFITEKISQPIFITTICIILVSFLYSKYRKKITPTKRSDSDKLFTNKKTSDRGKDKDKPFESSYYYAHNSSRVSGGYTDGLTIDDYEMNGPRLLSRNNLPIANHANKRSSINTVDHKSSITSIPIKKFSWEDCEDFVRIRIDSLPVKSSVMLTKKWEEANIPREFGNIEARLINDDLGAIVTVKGSDNDQYHLRINKLFGQATEIKTIRKIKRLIVKIVKKNKREWTSLESTVKDVDENEFMKDLDPSTTDPTDFMRNQL